MAASRSTRVTLWCFSLGFGLAAAVLAVALLVVGGGSPGAWLTLVGAVAVIIVAIASLVVMFRAPV